MMKFDELTGRAGQDLRDAAAGLHPPNIRAVRSSRRRRNGLAAVLTTFIGTSVVIGAVVLWPTTDGAGPASPPQPTTSIEAATTIPELSSREYLLLDGRIATVMTDSHLTLGAYSFFIDAPDMGGEHHVTVVLGEPAELAATETAEEEASLSDTVTLWRADREGQPLFLSVDLGEWVVWLNIGNQSNRPSSDALLQLAQQLTGTTEERGVVLKDLVFDFHELHLSGNQDEAVTLRIGTCFNEPVPGGEVIQDPRWGPVLRHDQRAAWCMPEGELEVMVDGSKPFVDRVVATIDIKVDETTPPPVSSSTMPATGPLFGEPVDVVLIFDDGIDGVLAVDPDNRVGSRSVIKGQAAGDQPYRLTRVDDQLVVGWGGVYAADLATRDSTLLGNATIYVPAVEPGLVWLVAYPSGNIQGTPSVWQANMAGDQLSDPQPIEAAGFPATGIPGGLALETDDGVALWDAGSGTVTRRLGTGSGFVSDASADPLAWCVSECSELHITNVSTGDDAVIPTRDEDTGFSGRPFGGRSARFSPDGTSLAAIAGDNVFLIDTLTGKADLIAQLPTNDPGYYLGWSPDGSQLFISSFSYQQSNTTLLRYDVENRTVDQVQLPFGGALSFVVVEADAAAPYLRDQDQEPSACRLVDTQPSGRTGTCGFRF